MSDNNNNIIKEEKENKISLENQNIDKKEEKESMKKEIDKPFYSDENKIIYKINNTPIIKEIAIIKTKQSPSTRSYLTADYSNNNNSIICIGGSDKSCEQFNKITEYNIKDNNWKYWNCDEQIEFDLELSGHSSNLIRVNKKEYIFIFGGFDNWKKDFTAQSYLINIQNKTFEKINYKNNKEKNEFPLPRTYHTSNYDEENQIIYIYGGTDMNINHCKNNNFQSVWAFSLEKKFWRKIEITNPNPIGVPRGHSSILYKNKLYIFGGVVQFKKFQNKLYTIDLKENKINNIDFAQDKNYKGVIPQPIAFHSSILINREKFIVHGGLDKNYNPINICYIFSFHELKFDKFSIPLIPNLFGHKLILNNTKNKLYIIGGMDSFKYVGDENLIYKIEEEGDNLFNKAEGQIDYQPMLNILEITLNIEEKKAEQIKENEDNKTNKVFKKRKWAKLFY